MEFDCRRVLMALLEGSRPVRVRPVPEKALYLGFSGSLYSSADLARLTSTLVRLSGGSSSWGHSPRDTESIRSLLAGSVTCLPGPASFPLQAQSHNLSFISFSHKGHALQPMGHSPRDANVIKVLFTRSVICLPGVYDFTKAKSSAWMYLCPLLHLVQQSTWVRHAPDMSPACESSPASLSSAAGRGEGSERLTIINSEDAVGVEGDGVDGLLGHLGRRYSRSRCGLRRCIIC